MTDPSPPILANDPFHVFGDDDSTGSDSDNCTSNSKNDDAIIKDWIDTAMVKQSQMPPLLAVTLCEKNNGNNIIQAITANTTNTEASQPNEKGRISSSSSTSTVFSPRMYPPQPEQTNGDTNCSSIIQFLKEKNVIQSIWDNINQGTTSPTPPTDIIKNDKDNDHTAPCGECVPIWSHRPMYEHSAVQIMNWSQFGGGRGYGTTQYIPSGTLILVEEPILTWSIQDNVVNISKLQLILQQQAIPKARQIIHQLEYLHPTKIIVDQYWHEDRMKQQQQQQHSSSVAVSETTTTTTTTADAALDVSSSSNPDQIEYMMDVLQKEYGNDSSTQSNPMQDLLQYAQHHQIYNSNGSVLTHQDMYRLLLVLRYNGLESGIYLHAAMLNHSDQPNCVKFLSGSASSQNNNQQSHQQPQQSLSYSEIRTTRPIQMGEALTISYVPKLMSYPSRRKHLWEQHRFDIGKKCTTSVSMLSPPSQCMEMIHQQYPSLSTLSSTPMTMYSSDTNNNPTNSSKSTTISERVEGTIAELEVLLDEVQSNITLWEIKECLERLQSLEMTIFELGIEIIQQLQNHQHILVLRCWQMYMNCCDTILQILPTHSTVVVFSTTTTTTRNPISQTFRWTMLRQMILVGHHVLHLQQLWYGLDHYDIARTCLDVAQCIQELLSESPYKYLFQPIPSLVTLFYLSTQSSNTNKNTDIPTTSSTTTAPPPTTTLSPPISVLYSYTTMQEWSKWEYQLRKEYHRIQTLYPHDASKLMNKS